MVGVCSILSEAQDSSEPFGISLHSWEWRPKPAARFFPFFDKSPGFDIFWLGVDSWSLLVPHWFLVLLFATTGILSIKWSRRFSLRTLLIATTLIAVGLGIVVAFS